MGAIPTLPPCTLRTSCRATTTSPGFTSGTTTTAATMSEASRTCRFRLLTRWAVRGRLQRQGPRSRSPKAPSALLLPLPTLQPGHLYNTLTASSVAEVKITCTSAYGGMSYASLGENALHRNADPRAGHAGAFGYRVDWPTGLRL